MTQTRLPFELDQRAEAAALTAHGGVPLVIEAFRVSGAAAVVDASVANKRRKRGLTSSQLVEGLFALWAAGGERCEDLAALREDAALAQSRLPVILRAWPRSGNAAPFDVLGRPPWPLP